MNFNDYMPGWLHDLAVGKRLERSTVATYEGRARRWLRWLDERNIRHDECDVATIDLYLDTHKSTMTSSGYLIVIRSFYSYMQRHVPGIDSNPAEALRVRTRRRYIPPPDLRIVEKLMRAWEEKPLPWGLRNATIVGMLVGGGLRASELVALQNKSVRFGEGSYIVVVPSVKSRRERVVPVGSISDDQGDGVAELIAKWRSYVNSTLGLHLDDPLFPSVGQARRGVRLKRNELLRGGRVPRLTTSTVWQIVANGPVRDRYLMPHGLRRLMGSTMVKEGVDIEQVRSILGHEEYGSLRSYIDGAAALSGGEVARRTPARQIKPTRGTAGWVRIEREHSSLMD